ncbi:CRISPR-associated endonuclease Cas2 [Patescibacteria group bacterium]|nr:CRISPR-associated endonuclease Cas2 [Patescibacteria group bacterium]MBU4000171.1 CRISPR-associated endonuclease Cas2 [Patescibacteria group bacterium]MBU4056508.1 CRISPR-associated endonuclease Cas2 [Patescibacteria group bacterium]MBU4368859.1 CRISPR-associated endonuclease Cas2 [Patescibacteria group bacterium]
MKKDTAKNITKSILFSLFALGAVGAIITLPGLALLGKEFTGWKKYKRFRLKSTFKRLEDQKMIKFFEKDDGVIELELTQKGHKRILRYQFEDMKIKIPHKWDGFWRMVSFDIPNNKKQAREALREKLIKLGFYKFQESVFVHPYDCKNEIDFIKNIFNIGPFVSFIVAKEIDNDFKLRKVFLLD